LKQRSVGKSDLSVSILGLGTEGFGTAVDEATAGSIVHAALDLGLNFIETADIYGGRGKSEELLGKVLGTKRKDAILATKFGSPMDDSGWLKGGSRRYIMEAVEASLRRLKTDWIDLYQIHNPDPETPIEETLRALSDLVTQGKVRYIGHSNFSAWQMVEADRCASQTGCVPFISSQLEYSLLNRDLERESLPTLSAYGVGLLPYLPLAAGMLTGRYRHGDTIAAGARISRSKKAARYRHEAVWPVVEELERFSIARGHSLLELAFGWLLSRQAVCSVMAGVSSVEQLLKNAGSIGWCLTDADIAEVDRITSSGGDRTSKGEGAI
jgi:aryl-alcohol dehydrogenase-like predicted oxidoreductase